MLGRLLSEEGKVTGALQINHHHHDDNNHDDDEEEVNGMNNHRDDTRQQLRSAISSLATVPEFYHFVNACVRRLSVAQAMSIAGGGRGMSGRTGTRTVGDTSSGL